MRVNRKSAFLDKTPLASIHRHGTRLQSGVRQIPDSYLPPERIFSVSRVRVPQLKPSCYALEPAFSTWRKCDDVRLIATFYPVSFVLPAQLESQPQVLRLATRSPANLVRRSPIEGGRYLVEAVIHPLSLVPLMRLPPPHLVKIQLRL